MRRTALIAGLLALGATGCGGARTSYVRSSDTVLGRVVIYRNGVAYFERSATVEGDTLRLAGHQAAACRPSAAP